MDPGRVVKWRKKEISKFKIQDTAELFWPLGVFLTRKKTGKNTENKDKKRPIIACSPEHIEGCLNSLSSSLGDSDLDARDFPSRINRARPYP
ncbi:hypothetical protein KQX54_016066 [Cotesia glomerata]|uniref:Uncharacterized protein n=1 Tax=Cotesia glomerata TaxID=32391 RepID=A0AAV7HVG9_COTGL|nr:hypothetical protein KQX54_016066 [Cotesia glomerata]